MRVDMPREGCEALTEAHSGSWELVVPAPAEWINLNQRLHWAAKAELTRTWRQAAHVYARKARLPQGLRRVRILVTVMKPTSRAYDVHNLMPTVKAAVDGLVDYGLIPDDTNSHLEGPDLRPAAGKGPAQIHLLIEEIPAVGG